MCRAHVPAVLRASAPFRCMTPHPIAESSSPAANKVLAVLAVTTYTDPAWAKESTR
jgi:hypothetical protein